MQLLPPSVLPVTVYADAIDRIICYNQSIMHRYRDYWLSCSNVFTCYNSSAKKGCFDSSTCLSPTQVRELLIHIRDGFFYHRRYDRETSGAEWARDAPMRSVRPLSC